MKLKCRTNRVGEGGLPILIILVLMAGGVFWWLFSSKHTAVTEGREFANDVAQRLAVNHDAAFLEEHMSPNAKTEMPPAARGNFMETLTNLGAPGQPIAVQGSITFESYFFEPRGSFSATLNYPARPGRMDFTISHPAGMWKIDSIGFSLQSAR